MQIVIKLVRMNSGIPRVVKESKGIPGDKYWIVAVGECPKTGEVTFTPLQPMRMEDDTVGSE